MLWPTEECWSVLSDLKGPDICNVHSNEAGYSLHCLRPSSGVQSHFLGQYQSMG